MLNESVCVFIITINMNDVLIYLDGLKHKDKANFFPAVERRKVSLYARKLLFVMHLFITTLLRSTLIHIFFQILSYMVSFPMW